MKDPARGKVEHEAMTSPDGFPSRLDVPSGWKARHRNLKVWRDESMSDVWFMEPLPEQIVDEHWAETTFGVDAGASIHYRGRIDFSFRVGTADIERRANVAGALASEMKDGDLALSKVASGNFTDEETYRLSTGE